MRWHATRRFSFWPQCRRNVGARCLVRRNSRCMCWMLVSSSDPSATGLKGLPANDLRCSSRASPHLSRARVFTSVSQRPLGGLVLLRPPRWLDASGGFTKFSACQTNTGWCIRGFAWRKIVFAARFLIHLSTAPGSSTLPDQYVLLSKIEVVMRLLLDVVLLDTTRLGCLTLCKTLRSHFDDTEVNIVFAPNTHLILGSYMAPPLCNRVYCRLGEDPCTLKKTALTRSSLHVTLTQNTTPSYLKSHIADIYHHFLRS